MTIRIGSTIGSLNAQRRLSDATGALDDVYERLSSGLRINKAADDAAGLAVALSLSTNARVFNQGIRNLNDGISLFSIADATLESLVDITTRLQELAAQAANGSYSSSQRGALNNEAQELAQEYFRISRSASFNGQRLFDGSLSGGVRLQGGYGTDGSVFSRIGASLGTGGVSQTGQFAGESNLSRSVQLGDINGDGILDMVSSGQADGSTGYVTVRLGDGSGSFGSAQSIAIADTNAVTVSLADIDDDGILDIVAGGVSNVFTLRGNGNGTFQSAVSYATGGTVNSITIGDVNGDGQLDLITGQYGGGFVAVRLGQGGGTFGSATNQTVTGANNIHDVTLADVNGDGILDLLATGLTSSLTGRTYVLMGSGNGTFGAATTYNTTNSTGRSYSITLGDLNGDGILDLVTGAYEAGAGNGAWVNVRLGQGDGSFGTSTSYLFTGNTGLNRTRDVELADLNGDGILDLITTGSRYTDNQGILQIRLGRGDGTFGDSNTRAVAGLSRLFDATVRDINGDGVLDIVTAGFNASSGFLDVFRGETRDGISPIVPFSLETRAAALEAVSIFGQLQNILSSARATIGATQSRLSSAVNNLSSTRENFISAEKRITSADIATEAAQLIRLQILQQGATSVLASANVSSDLAVKLLS